MLKIFLTLIKSVLRDIPFFKQFFILKKIINTWFNHFFCAVNQGGFGDLKLNNFRVPIAR